RPRPWSAPGERNSERSKRLTRPLSKVTEHEPRCARTTSPTRPDGGQGGRAAATPPRRPGPDRGPQPVLGRDAHAVHRGRLLPYAAATDVRRLRVRSADLLSHD